MSRDMNSIRYNQNIVNPKSGGGITAMLAITNGTIIDGLGGDPRTAMTLLIEDERITALGRQGEVAIPRGTQVIDAMGGSILPGLIDTHVHFTLEYPEILRAGADWIKLATTGGVLSTSDAPTSSQLTVEEIATAVYEAAAQEKRCMAHAQGTQGIKNALQAGVASIEHGVYLTNELIDMMLSQGTYLVPTLIAPISVVQFSQAHPDLLPPMMATKAVGLIDAHKKSFRMAVEAGVKIAMGTDSGVGLHGENGKELQLLAENGMTSIQTIQASTSQAAQLLHLADTLGTLEVGKLADVIIVNGDVLNDISKIANPANIQLVLKAGRAVKNLLESPVPVLSGSGVVTKASQSEKQGGP